jgi:hypothetical protein
MTNLSAEGIIAELISHNNPKVFITPDELSDEIKVQIPNKWSELINLGNVDLSRLREYWKSVYELIPVTMEEMEATIQGLVLLTEDGQPPSLLYVFINDEDGLDFYRGFPPMNLSQQDTRTVEIMEVLPGEFRKLYEIHNGWYFLYPMSRGHLPTEKWSFLKDDEWGLESEALKKIPIDPDRTLIVYAHGGGGYLGIELPAGREQGKAMAVEIWSRDIVNPTINLDFWMAYDEWTSAFFVEMGLRL